MQVSASNSEKLCEILVFKFVKFVFTGNRTLAFRELIWSKLEFNYSRFESKLSTNITARIRSTVSYREYKTATVNWTIRIVWLNNIEIKFIFHLHFPCSNFLSRSTTSATKRITIMIKDNWVITTQKVLRSVECAMVGYETRVGVKWRHKARNDTMN